MEKPKLPEILVPVVEAVVCPRLLKLVSLDMCRNCKYFDGIFISTSSHLQIFIKCKFMPRAREVLKP